MPNISEMSRELVRVFNINLCYNNIIFTNLTVQNLYDRDHIVILFDGSMDPKQCMKYLGSMKEKIVKRFYKDEKAAGVCFDLKSFPFAFDKRQLHKDNQGRVKFLVPMDKGVVFNLKSYLARALVGDINERMGDKFGGKYVKKHAYSVDFDRSSYLHCTQFLDKELQDYFFDSFTEEIKSYPNPPSNCLEVRDNYVYIKKGIFDNVEFIKDITTYNTSLICRDFRTPSKEDKDVENLKFPIIDFIRRMGIQVHSMFRTSYKGSDEDSILVPIVYQTPIVDQNKVRFLNKNDISKINSIFGMEILSDVGRNISTNLPKSDSSDSIVYGIDFSNVNISCCVMNKIMENSVINKKHELTIDPELQLSLPPKRKQRLPLSSSVDEDEGACAGLPKSMDFPPDEACTSQQPYGQPSSMIFENRLTQLTDQQARFKDAQSPVRSPWSETQIGVAALGVGESVPGPSGNSLKLSEPYSPPVSPTSENELADRSQSPVAGCCYPTGDLLKKMNSVLSFGSRSSSFRSSRSSSNLSNIRVTQPPKQDKVLEVS